MRPIVVDALLFLLPGTLAAAAVASAAVLITGFASLTGGSGDAFVFMLPMMMFPGAIVIGAPGMLAAGIVSGIARQLALQRWRSGLYAALAMLTSGLLGALWLFGFHLMSNVAIACMVMTAFVFAWRRADKLDNNAVPR